MPELVVTHPANPDPARPDQASPDPASPDQARSVGGSDRLTLLLEPRDDVVAERRSDPIDPGRGRFELVDGPFRHWERDVVGHGDGTITETIRYQLAIPLWSALFDPLLRRWLRRTSPSTGPGRRAMPWWAPPQRLDAQASTTLGLLASVALVAGYLGTLLTQTNTYAKSDFGSTDGEIGTMLAAVRAGALLALIIVAVSDRMGRSKVLTMTSVAACVLTATGALAPGLVWLGASQTLARSLSTAMALLISVMVVEATPAGSRAYAISLLTMTAGLGAGLAAMLLFVGDIGTGGWRILFLVPLLPAVPLGRLWWSLPETDRFRAARAGRVADGPTRWTRSHIGRLVLLSGSGLLLALFVSPAAGFQNEYLRTDHGYDGWQITLFVILTNTPAGLGILAGGKLADVHGRRRVGALGLAAGSVLTVAMYLGSGWSIWAWSLGAAVLGAVAVPALAVYGPELFPTSTRGRANGIINLFSVLGSAVGLIVVGQLADSLDGGLPVAVAWMVIGPIIVVGLILACYPETASRELEEINPEDAPLTKAMLELDGLDL